ncbi:MAG: 50S ribosomal protein L21 [Alphaproteobacteria bacterium]|jgi:large subunit ribosomal protein L21
MYAIIKTGGKQYKVTKGDVIRVEKLEAEAGKKIKLDEVLMIGGDKPAVGSPIVKGASVEAEVVEQTRNKKIIIFKKKRRHNYRRKNGHRQAVSILKITDIKA